MGKMPKLFPQFLFSIPFCAHINFFESVHYNLILMKSLSAVLQFSPYLLLNLLVWYFIKAFYLPT